MAQRKNPEQSSTFMVKQTEAFARTRAVRTFFSQTDLERRAALLQMRLDPLTVAIDTRIAGRDYQVDCLETVCREIGLGRRKVLLEMVTGTGKMLGRGTRKSQGKPVFTLFDFVGVADAHEGDDGYAEGGNLTERDPRPRPDPRTLVTVDQNDEIDPLTRSWVTMDDAGNFVFMEASEEKANELGARFEGWLMGQEFTLDHLEFPPFSLQGGRRKAAELFGGETPLSGVLANLSRSVYGAPLQ
ncbi:MAG: hypothetical protein IPH35_02680 [Rhodoferax sp.]|nr:hypothetical protein [Rhodoferax sp.]